MSADNGQVRYLTLEDIEAVPDIQEDDVEVPEWGGTVRVRGFTKELEMSIREEAKDADDEIDREKLEMLFLVYGMIEPQASAASIPMLMSKSSAATNRVLRKIMELSGLDTLTREKKERAFREGPAPAVLVPVGEGFGDDGGAVEEGHVEQ